MSCWFGSIVSKPSMSWNIVPGPIPAGSPFEMMSIPISTCFFTSSLISYSTRSGGVGGGPIKLFPASGMTSLPVWVARIRSVLRFIRISAHGRECRCPLTLAPGDPDSHPSLQLSRQTCSTDWARNFAYLGRREAEDLRRPGGHPPVPLAEHLHERRHQKRSDDGRVEQGAGPDSGGRLTGDGG